MRRGKIGVKFQRTNNESGNKCSVIRTRVIASQLNTSNNTENALIVKKHGTGLFILESTRG